MAAQTKIAKKTPTATKVKAKKISIRGPIRNNVTSQNRALRRRLAKTAEFKALLGAAKARDQEGFECAAGRFVDYNMKRIATLDDETYEF
jgi:hypothetical protein